MAINFTDFSRAPIIASPWKNLFENVLQGYKIEQEPAKMAQETQQRELSNKLKKLEVEHKPTEYSLSDQEKTLANSLKDLALKHQPKEYSLADALKEEQLKQLQRTGGKGGAKVNGMVANFVATHPEATQDEIKAFADQVLQSQLRHTEAVTGRSEDITSGSSFDKQPVNEKKRAIGLTTAMGIDPIEGLKLLRSGQSLRDIADSKGFLLEELTPMYPLGEENVKQLQKRSGFVNEIKNLEDKIIGGMGKYQNKLYGYSLEQMADALSGENPEEQGKVLAARALQPELAALRLKVAGGNIGIEAIRELQDKSLGNLKILESLVDSPTYIAMQKYMTKYLEEAANEFNRTMEDYGRLRSNAQKKSEIGVKIFNPSTGRLE